jgi:uncharacterized protein (DUF2336 family)
MSESTAPQSAQPVDAIASLPGLVPFMTDDALIDLVSIGNVVCQMAIAAAPSLRPQIGAAIAEVGSGPALITLAHNHHVDLRPFSMTRMIERFGTERKVLTAIESRPDLTDDIWGQLAAARLRLLLDGMDESLSEDDVERLVISMLKDVSEKARDAYARHFVRAGTVTPGLLFRSILSGEADVFSSLVSALTEMPFEEILTTVRVATPENVEALAALAGVPDAFVPAFAAAIAALRSERGFADKSGPVRVNPEVLSQFKALITRDEMQLHRSLIDRLTRIEAELSVVPQIETLIEAEKAIETNVTPFRKPGARDAA